MHAMSFSKIAMNVKLAVSIGCFVLAPTAVAQNEASVVDLDGGAPGSSGSLHLEYSGAPVLGRAFALRLTNAEPFGIGFMAASADDAPIPFPASGAVAHPAWPFSTTQTAFFDAEGASPPFLASPVVGPSLVGTRVVVQGVAYDPLVPDGFAFSNALDIEFGIDDGAPSLPGLMFPLDGISDAAVHDVDVDGVEDLMVAQGSFDVRVYRGVGDGTFEPSTSVASTLEVRQIELLDADHDGILDLALGGHGASALEIHPGLSSGGFGAPVLVPTSQPLEDELVVADLDGDGFLDLIGHDGNSDIDLLFGRADGTFDALVFDSATHPRNIEVADIDGDGLQDIVMRAASTISFGVLAGLGARQFAPIAEVLPSGAVAFGSFVLEDLDGDGRIDVLGVFRQGLTPKSVCVWVQQIGGSFDLGWSEEFSSPFNVVALLRHDESDGSVDLVVQGLHRMKIYEQVGIDGFENAREIATGIPASLMLEIDANVDGFGDFIGLLGVPSTFTVLLSDSDGRIQGIEHRTAHEQARTVLTPDLDGDNYPDLLTHATGDTFARSYVVAADGAVVPDATAAVALAANWVVTADFDGDERDDVASGNGVVAFVSKRGSSGGFDLPTLSYDPTRSTHAVAADFDADGAIDLVVNSPVDDSVRVLQGDGAGGFTPGPSVGLPFEPGPIAVGDFDGDGAVDAAVMAQGGSELAILGNDGLGGAVLLGVLSMPGASLDRHLRVGDVNRDGALDLTVVSEGIDVFLGSGDATFTALPTIPFLEASEEVVDVMLRDLDRDGRADLCGAVVVPYGSTVHLVLRVRYGSDSLGFGPVEEIALSPIGDPQALTFADLAAIDLDRDGLPDPVAFDPVLPGFLILPNQLYR